MSALPSLDRHHKRTGWQLLRFAATGLSATFLYIFLVLVIEKTTQTLPGFIIAFLAYAICGAYTYFTHKFFTFRSKGAHDTEAPRYLALTIFGYLFVAIVTAILHDLAQWPIVVPTLICAVAIPIANYLVMQRMIFRSR